MSTVRQSMRLAKKRATVNSGDRKQSKLIANQQEKEIEQHSSQRSYSRRRITVKKEKKKEHVDDETIDKSDSIVIINRAPVLTLWSALVAKKLYDIRWENALTIGRRLAGLLAQSKGRSIGIFEPKEPINEETQPRKKRKQNDKTLKVLGINVPIKDTVNGPMAVNYDKLVSTKQAETYISNAFQEQLDNTIQAMEKLIEACSKNGDELQRDAYQLYEEFRPEVATGKKGWGKKGILDLNKIIDLTHRTRK